MATARSTYIFVADEVGGVYRTVPCSGRWEALGSGLSDRLQTPVGGH